LAFVEWEELTMPSRFSQKATRSQIALAAMLATLALPATADAAPCKRLNKTEGAVIGAVGGAVLGKVIAGGTTGTVLGALAGGVAGHEIARNGRKKCENTPPPAERPTPARNHRP